MFDFSSRARTAATRPVAVAVVAMTVLGGMWTGTAAADPAQDTVAQSNDLPRQALQLTEALHAAKADLDQRLQLLAEADRRQADDFAALEATTAQLAVEQAAADKVMTAMYVGGRADGLTAILTAPSPKILIDKLTVQRTLASQMSDRLAGFRRVQQDAQSVAAASAKSAADAKAAVDAAVAVRTDLQNKQSQLRAQLIAANVTGLPPSVMAALGLLPPVPTVGMGGLVPNARILVQYILATYPGVRSIGGVRSDPLPDHPSGHAVDIMIGSDMGLGDAINADIQQQAARFGVSYTMWRVAHHFDHVHITVS